MTTEPTRNPEQYTWPIYDDGDLLDNPQTRQVAIYMQTLPADERAIVAGLVAAKVREYHGRHAGESAVSRMLRDAIQDHA